MLDGSHAHRSVGAILQVRRAVMRHFYVMSYNFDLLRLFSTAIAVKIDVFYVFIGNFL